MPVTPSALHAGLARLRAVWSSLFARMALILLAGLLAAQLASLWLHWGERASVVSQARGLNQADRIAETVLLLEAGNAEQRPATVAALQSDTLHIALIAADQVSSSVPRGQIQSAIAARLGGQREIRSQGGGGGGGSGFGGGGGPGMQHASMMRSFDVRLNDGQWVRIVTSRETEAPALPSDFFIHLAFSLIIVVAVVMLAVRQASRPLQQLALAADTLGHDLDAPPLAESGFTETRRAAQAFNRMQGRIKRLVDERARALAAVSHDLRTPLTRLRLRAELVDDNKLREQMAADLDAMAAMIDATLDYLRGLKESEPARSIDMNALLESLAEDAQLLGREISVEGKALTPYRGRLSALRRAVQNLIDNAIKYGHGAHLRIEDDGMLLQLIVEDSGPGLPADELDRVTQPYYRPDSARRSETGGVGLGLSIVKDIALMHGGELQLSNRAQGGLAATLRLPRAPQSNAAPVSAR